MKMTKPPDTANSRRVGVVAGWGNFPVEVAERLAGDGKQVYVVALRGLADPRLERVATKIQWFGVLRLGSHLRFLASHNITQVAFAGKLFKDQILYHGLGWIKHLPDATCLRTLGSIFVTKSLDARDDTVLGAITNAFSKRGIQVLSIGEIAPSLLAAEGCLTRTKPTSSQLRDMRFGWSIARSMGGLDIGQSITVRDRLVLGVEAIEGTDALIARTGKLCPRGGFTLVKVAKPKQDMRFDVPTIGLRTLQQVVKAGGKAIAIEAGRTILVDREAVLAYANAHRIAIVSANSSWDALPISG